MKIKEKFKMQNILKILVFTLILLIAILGLSNNVKGTTELVGDDVPDLWNRNTT